MTKKVLWLTTCAVLLAIVMGCSSKGSEMGKHQGPVSLSDYPPSSGGAEATRPTGSGK